MFHKEDKLSSKTSWFWWILNFFTKFVSSANCDMRPQRLDPLSEDSDSGRKNREEKTEKHTWKREESRKREREARSWNRACSHCQEVKGEGLEVVERGRRPQSVGTAGRTHTQCQDGAPATERGTGWKGKHKCCSSRLFSYVIQSFLSCHLFTLIIIIIIQYLRLSPGNVSFDPH